jgi:acyl-CoA hydrolase
VKKEEFAKAYKNLNKEQKEAVDTIDGPVMVIAGPGTGKTTLLTLRIANILRLTDTPAESILALTFTESGVASMKKKLFEIVGDLAYRVKISTFHSFANEIIQNYPQFFPNQLHEHHRVQCKYMASSLDANVMLGDQNGHRLGASPRYLGRSYFPFNLLAPASGMARRGKSRESEG